jgi:hypothetical protein
MNKKSSQKKKRKERKGKKEEKEGEESGPEPKSLSFAGAFPFEHAGGGKGDHRSHNFFC